jgi:hypothetical protein
MGLNYNPTIVPDGLVMYMDITNSRSYSGSGNTVYNLVNGGIAGTIVTGITYDTDNKKNLNFNGSSGYMFSNDTSMDFSTSDFTIQTTVKLNGLSNGFTGAYGTVICAGAALTNNSSILQFVGTATSHYAVGLWHQPTSTTIGRNYNFQTNKIYNIAVVKNTSQVEFFVDGTSIGTTSTSNYFNFTANGFGVGRWYYPGYEQYLKGNIYDLKAYNRALSNSEILQNYNASKGRYTTLENITTNGLILNIDSGNSNSYSGIGNTIYDLSGFGNTGTLTNGPTFSGLNGGSIVFDGTFKYILFSNNIDTNKDFTVNFWNRRLSTGATHNLLHGVNQTNYFQIRYNYLNVVQLVNSNIVDMGSFTGYTSTANNDVYLTVRFTKSSSTYDLFINGNYISSITNAQTFVTSGPVLGSGYPGSEHFNGRIYSFTCYNRALSATEILQNYNATKSRFGL